MSHHYYRILPSCPFLIVEFQSIVHCHCHVLPSSPQDIVNMSHYYCRILPSCPFLTIKCSQFLSSIKYGLVFGVTIQFVETWLLITIVSCLQGKFVASLSPHTKCVTSLSPTALCWSLVSLLKNRSPQTSRCRVSIYEQLAKVFILHIVMSLIVLKIVYVVSECWHEMKSKSP